MPGVVYNTNAMAELYECQLLLLGNNFCDGKMLPEGLSWGKTVGKKARRKSKQNHLGVSKNIIKYHLFSWHCRKVTRNGINLLSKLLFVTFFFLINHFIAETPLSSSNYLGFCQNRITVFFDNLFLPFKKRVVTIVTLFLQPHFTSSPVFLEAQMCSAVKPQRSSFRKEGSKADKQNPQNS